MLGNLLGERVRVRAPGVCGCVRVRVRVRAPGVCNSDEVLQGSVRCFCDSD